MLLKTATSEKHYHLAFIRDDGSGYTSVNSNHFHAISPSKSFETFEINQKEAVEDFYKTDPEERDNDRSVAVDQMLKKFKLCKVFMVNGHTHELDGLKLRKIKSETENLSDEEKVRRIYDLTYKAMELDRQNKSKAYEAIEFFTGDQWGADIRKILDRYNRTGVTLNYTKRFITFLSGLFRQNKTDIQVLPEEESDVFAVDLLNPALRRVQHNTSYHKHEIQAFDDTIKVGRGALLVEIDTKTNPLGDIAVKYFPWNDYSVSEHIELDASDAEYIALHPKYSLNKVKAMYPEKADEITASFTMLEHQGVSQTIVPVDKPYHQSLIDEPFSLYGHVHDKRFIDPVKRNITVIKLMEKEPTNKKVAINPIEDEYVDVTRLNRDDLKKFNNFEGFAIVNSYTEKIKITIVSGTVLLEERYSIFNDFNLCFSYASKEGNKWWGIIEDVKDPQREINKWSSKFSDMLNQEEAWHLGVSPSAFKDEGDYREYLENAATPGYQPKFADGYQEHVREFNNSNFSQLRDLLTGIDLAIKQMSDITNLSSSTLGASNVSESGVALAQKMRTGLIGNDYIFDNFSIMKLQVGKLILQGIQKVWSPERILRLVESQSTREAITLGGDALYPQLNPQELIQFGINSGILSQQDAELLANKLKNKEEELDNNSQAILANLQKEYNAFRREKILLVLENKDLTKYDVSVVENTHSPTTMLSNFMVLSDLAKTRPDLPIGSLIETYPFLSQEQKNEILNQMGAQKQSELDLQRMKSETELKKVALANQGNTQGAPPPQQNTV